MINYILLPFFFAILLPCMISFIYTRIDSRTDLLAMDLFALQNFKELVHCSYIFVEKLTATIQRTYTYRVNIHGFIIYLLHIIILLSISI